MLRFRNGIRAGRADASGLGTAALVAGLILVGHIHVSRPASITCTMAQDVAEIIPDGTDPSVHTVWKIGDDIEEVVEAVP